VAFDKTHDAQASQEWCPAVLDTNGDGTITDEESPVMPRNAAMAGTLRLIVLGSDEKYSLARCS